MNDDEMTFVFLFPHISIKLSVSVSLPWLILACSALSTVVSHASFAFTTATNFGRRSLGAVHVVGPARRLIATPANQRKTKIN